MIPRDGVLGVMKSRPRASTHMDTQAHVPRNSSAGATCVRILLATLLGIFGGRLTASGQVSGTPEMTTRDSQPTFKLQAQRNVVLVRVLVRDSEGRPVGDLRKEDFKLFDNRKPQLITHFSVEMPPSQLPAKVEPTAREAQSPEETPSPSTPRGYLALYFDDLNAAFEHLVHARDAANRYLQGNLQPSDRAGIFTASGLGTLDFTDDLGKLHEALFKLRPNPRINPRMECPEISDYQADRIVNFEDREAIEVATDETVNRCHEDGRGAEQRVRAYAQRALGQYEFQARYCLEGLERLARYLAGKPGQRNIVLVCPGFLPLGLQSLVGDVADQALRSQVVISSLDPKGLIVNLRIADASWQYFPADQRLLAAAQRLDTFRELAASAVLEELAEATGGEYFHSNNDLDAGFREVVPQPQVYYILAFSPQNLKLDGSFHSLKVALVGKRGLSVNARRGYFAPKKRLDPEEQANEEIEGAVFSQAEVQELPIDVHTQFFKASEMDAELSVLTHLDVRPLQFRKEGDRNANDVTFVAVLFDRNGNYLMGKQKRVELRLSDASLEKVLTSGITMKMNFTVKPGTYMVRGIVRDVQGGQISALNRFVEIPF